MSRALENPSKARGQKLEEARRKIEARLHGGPLVSWIPYGYNSSSNV